MKPAIYLCSLGIYFLVLISFIDAQISFPDDDGLAPGLKAFPVPAASGGVQAAPALSVPAATIPPPAVLPGANGQGLPPVTSNTFPTALPTPPNFG